MVLHPRNLGLESGGEAKDQTAARRMDSSKFEEIGLADAFGKEFKAKRTFLLYARCKKVVASFYYFEPVLNVVSQKNRRLRRGQQLCSH
jgi:hypothetical protein